VRIGLCYNGSWRLDNKTIKGSMSLVSLWINFIRNDYVKLMILLKIIRSKHIWQGRMGQREMNMFGLNSGWHALHEQGEIDTDYFFKNESRMHKWRNIKQRSMTNEIIYRIQGGLSIGLLVWRKTWKSLRIDIFQVWRKKKKFIKSNTSVKIDVETNVCLKTKWRGYMESWIGFDLIDVDSYMSRYI